MLLWWNYSLFLWIHYVWYLMVPCGFNWLKCLRSIFECLSVYGWKTHEMQSIFTATNARVKIECVLITSSDKSAHLTCMYIKLHRFQTRFHRVIVKRCQGTHTWILINSALCSKRKVVSNLKGETQCVMWHTVMKYNESNEEECHSVCLWYVGNSPDVLSWHLLHLYS